MQLQTRNAHMKGKIINLNGTHYEVGQDLCIDIEDETNIQKAIQTGWQEDILETRNPKKRGRPAVPPPSLQSAKEFVALVAAQPKLQEACEVCETFSVLLKDVANVNGYNFNKDHLNQARSAYVKRNADIRPGDAAPQHSALAREAGAVAATARGPDPEAPRTEDEMSTPFGSYSKAILKTVARELGVKETELLMAAYEVDEDREEPTGYHGLNDFKAAAMESGLIPLGADPDAEVNDGEPKAVVQTPPPADPVVQTPPADQGGGDVQTQTPPVEQPPVEQPPAENPTPDPYSKAAIAAHHDKGVWPEPTAEMPIEFLREMADGYELKYPSNIGSAKLIERILEKMYPPE